MKPPPHGEPPSWRLTETRILRVAARLVRCWRSGNRRADMRPETWWGDMETLRQVEIEAMPMARPQGRQSLNVSCLRSLVSPLLPAIGRAAARPLVGRGLRTRRVNGTPLDRPRPARSRLAVRAPCAHQWLAKASHKAKRFQKHFGSAKGFAKGPAYRLKLFSIFFKNPLARNGTMWSHYGASKTRLGSRRALDGWRKAQ